MKKHIYLAAILTLIFCSCSTEKEEPNLESQYPVGSVFGPSGPTKVVDVTNPKTGRTWMDRNLGATRAATSSTDVEAYGDLYQWGRGSDGHQLRNSTTTKTLSNTDQPGNGSFILFSPGFKGDWRSPQNNSLWQGVDGKNNPCPSGYRIPTDAEWNAERLSWSTNTSVGALASPLKLPMGGDRDHTKGSFFEVGTLGEYWSSTVNSTNSVLFAFDVSDVGIETEFRAVGFSVRCIKN
jgi:uncharacterized protein (TIGR02145 family)